MLGASHFSKNYLAAWKRRCSVNHTLLWNYTFSVISVTGVGRFIHNGPRPLFRANPGFYNVSYDVSPDGTKFIVNTAPEERTAPITVVGHWLSDLKR